MQRITRLFIGLLWLCTLFPLASQAQQADTVRQGQTVQRTDTARTGRNYSDEKIWRIGKGIYTDTIRRNDFKASAADVVELDDCDTTFQTFLLVRRPSPWRLGLYLGPNFAYCGTWDATFGNDRRDNTLYNGTGINFTANLDYYLTRSTRRLRFGVGTAFGYQNSFTRSAYRDELFGLGQAAGFTRDQIEIKSRPSEDMFLLVGPVISFDFLRGRKNPERTSFIEAGIRGGIFRSEAATITGAVPSVANQLIRSVNPSTSLIHPGALFSLGVFFPIGNYWHLGLQAQGYYTRLNYLIVNGNNVPAGAGPSTLFEFTRKNGGFNVGLGVRKDFRQKKLIPKAPVTCPVCDSIPALAVQFNNTSLMGMSMALDSTLPARTLPVISWSSTTLNPKNETFTARLHYKVDSLPSTRDSVIAQLINTTDTTLAFPTAHVDTAGKPRRGFYYVTVHSRQESKCGACMSEVATTSFAFLPPKFTALASAPCTFKNRLDRLEVFYRTPYTRDIANVCYCNGVITQVGDTLTRLRYRGLNRRLALQPFEFVNGDGALNLRELPADLAKLLQDEKRKIESGRAITYKGRRIRPQVSYFRSVFTVEEEPCPANGMKGRTVGSFQVTISDNSYTITDLKPLTEEQRIRLTTPPKPAPARRGSGRRSVSFDVNSDK